MKKRQFIAIICLSTTLLMAACTSSQPGAPGGTNTGSSTMPNMQTFYNALSPEVREKFSQLDTEHQIKAIERTLQTKDPAKAVDEQYNDQMNQNQSS